MSSSRGICDYVGNMQRSFHPLNPFLKIFSLNCDKFQSRKYTCVKIVTFILPTVILGLIDGYTLYQKIQCFYKDMAESIKYTDAVQVIFDYFQYVVDLFVVYKYGIYLQEYYGVYQKIDEVLGMKYCVELQNKLRVLVIFYGTIWAISCGCDYWAWSCTLGWQTASIFSVSYVFLLIKILTSVDMTSHVMHIEFRLRNIADNAESLFNPIERLKISNEGRLYNHQKVPDIKLITVGQVRGTNLNEIKWLCKCYLWVIELTTFINQVFGTRVLLNILSILIDMVRFTNIAVRIILGSQHLHKNSTNIFPVVSTVMRLMTCVTMVVGLAKHCEMAYKQRFRIIDVIDHIVVIKEPSEDIRAALNELRQLVQTRSVDFQMENLTRIDYSLLGSMASIVVTYTIILLQSVD